MIIDIFDTSMETIIASVLAFATTNIDDIFILTLFFSNAKFKTKNVVIGQYLGIGALITISFVGSFIGLVIDSKYIGLLGLIPFYIGIKSAINLIRQTAQNVEHNVVTEIHSSKNGVQVFSVASVTIANGGDNISIYIPLFAALTMSDKFSMTFVFLIMTALWCFFAQYLSKRPRIQITLEKYAHIITPCVFIFLGIYLMYESKTFDLLSIARP